MSPFERAAWNWYWDIATAFAMESGIVAEEWKALGLKGKVKALFLRAVSAVHETIELIREDRRKREAESRR